ncbi:MAG: hypothetical protein HY261_06510 [Chloroflexi bacterium]|nr:hypothetical protein [Chloroflexota bacterium]
MTQLGNGRPAQRLKGVLGKFGGTAPYRFDYHGLCAISLDDRGSHVCLISSGVGLPIWPGKR